MANKLNERVRKFNFHPFPYNLTVVVSDDIAKSIRKRADALNLDDPGDDCAACVYSFKDGRCFMFMPDKPRMAWVVHETSHVVVNMMQYAGVSMDKEVLAYYTGELSETIWKFSNAPAKRRKSSRQFVPNPS